MRDYPRMQASMKKRIITLFALAALSSGGGCWYPIYPTEAE
jgi:hypothetical protein